MRSSLLVPALAALIGLSANSLWPDVALAAGRVTVNVDPQGTWLFRDTCDVSTPPSSLDLAASGIASGDVVTVARKGSYIFKSGGYTSKAMIAVFAAADGSLLSPGGGVKVRPAITSDTYCSGTPTDVPQDFKLKGNVPVAVPEGAAFLLFSPPDSLFRDNISQNYRAVVSRP